MSTSEATLIQNHSSTPAISLICKLMLSATKRTPRKIEIDSNTPTANEHDTPFHNKSTWNPTNDRGRALNTFLDAVKLDITTGKPNTIHDNLTATERQAIRQLKQRQDIIIKPADKGSGTVVIDKTGYIDECNRHLNLLTPNSTNA